MQLNKLLTEQRKTLPCLEQAHTSGHPPPTITIHHPSTTQVHTSDPELFEDHFNHSYACGSLDGNDAHACWPLYNVDYYPRWASLDDGVHTVEVVVTHPNSAEEIEVKRESTTQQRMVLFDGTTQHHMHTQKKRENQTIPLRRRILYDTTGAGP